jgi:RNA polymerase sigma factor (sigma-70 family)
MSRSALAAGVRYLRKVVASQGHQQDSDERLLHDFVISRDETAFAALVRRYGPMVGAVCRRVLVLQQDAEDAFQATFLVLAQNAARLRKKTALASFLHGTAYRISLKAKRTAARRRKYEGQVQTRPSINPIDELSWREVRTLVDEEVARLPEKYRSAFILCCLESVSQGDAAQRLGIKEGTLSSRLTRARKLLSQRLARRGVELAAVLAASTLATQPTPALSPVLVASTMQAALSVNPAVLVSDSVAEMIQDTAAVATVSKIKVAAAVLLATGVLAGAGVWACRTPTTPQAVGHSTETPKSLATAKPRRDKEAVVMVKGRVLLPDGKPAANATIIRRQANEEKTGFKDTVVATTWADGRFEVEPRDSTILIASAPGFAPDWRGGSDFKGGDLTLTLAEQTTVRGRLISLEGKPIVGARVKVLWVNCPTGHNLKAVKDALRLNPEVVQWAMPKGLDLSVPGSPVEAKTGGDGRFELKGYGKNRVVELRIEGDDLVSEKVYLILEDDFDPKTVLSRSRERSGSMSPDYHPAVYGPSFTHAVRPCQIITGMVTDDVTGKPIPGVKVVGTAGSIRIFDYSAWHDAVESTTDRDGRYRLHGLAKAKQRYLHVQAGAAPYLDRLIDVPDAPGVASGHLDVKLHKAVVIEGQLLDKETGKGVRGEALFLLLECDEVRRFLADNRAYSQEQSVRPSGMHAPSDAEGRFKLHVPPAPLVLLAWTRDAAARYIPLRVTEADRKYLRKPPKRDATPSKLRNRNAKEEFFDTHELIWPLRGMNGYVLVHPKSTEETVKVVITFDPGRTIRGKIVGPDGRPLRGVEAAGVQGASEQVPTTFRTEAFTVYALDPTRPRTVYFRHAEKNLVGTIALRGDETEAPVVKMQAGAAVVGRVLDATGKPLARLGVNIQFAESEPDSLIRQHNLYHWDKPPITDANGHFRLEGLFPGLEFSVFASHPGHRSVAINFDGVTLKAGEVRDLGERREQQQR